MTDARNVLGEPLAECCTKPVTGFYRDGSCNTGPEDVGMHTVCTQVDAAFLAIDDLAKAQVLADRLTRKHWQRFLDALARRVNPFLGGFLKG